MAMAQTLLPPLNPPNPKLFSPCPCNVKLFYKSRSQPRVVSIRKLRSLVLQASKDDKEVGNSDFTSSSSPLLSLIDASSWMNWLNGASFILSVPLYRRIRKAQDQIEAKVNEVANVMENVAEKVEKISSDMANVSPEGTSKEMVLSIEKTKTAEEAGDESATETHFLIEKITVGDKIEAEVDELVEPLTKGKAA
ncbi:hypothetical protein DsansV1_C06g0066011 [Dioscorea sansibarensis]